MRNNNGGFLVVGLDNAGKPDYLNAPKDARTKFHFDKMQGLVTKYASESFESDVFFQKKDSAR